MNLTMRKITLTVGSLLVLLAATACNDSNKQEAPVRLVVTNVQTLTMIDLAGDPAGDVTCRKGIGTITLSAVTVGPGTANPNVSRADLNQVLVDRYEVTYQRIDGGKLVPAPIVRSTGITLLNGQQSPGTIFQLLDPNALDQAPFASLFPQNGGVDPETGRRIISMDLIITFFGQTLAGERVTGTTRESLNFCFQCGGCEPKS